MNQQIYLFATVFLSVAVVFLFYQNVKMERKFKREMKTITDNMREMTQMIALNNDISTSKQVPPSNLDFTVTTGNAEHPQMIINELSDISNENIVLAEPEVTPGLVNEMSTLMKDYSEFNEDQLAPEYTPEELNQSTNIQEEKYDSISEELKKEIEDLEKRDSSSECLDENTLEVNTEQDLEEQLNNISEVPMEIENLEDEIEEQEIENLEGNQEPEEEDELEEIKTFDQNALEQLNTSEDYKNMVDDIIATASEAENNNDTEESKASWDGSVDITDEGVFVELDNQRKLIDTLSVKELTYLCKMSGLKSKGKKADLIARFRDYITQKKNTFFLESN